MAEKGKESEWKKLKLISVAFKEASLDTPSFRASMNFYQSKVEAFEEWIEKSVAFFENKYSTSFEDFQRAQQTFLSQLLPSPLILSNGFVANQAYTPSLVESFNTDYIEFTSKILKMISGSDSAYPDLLLELMNNAIEPYKARRSDFEYYQSKYDNMLINYHAMKVSNTSIEPTSIREDAFLIYEVRKGYLKASLELIGAISLMKLSLDRFLMQSVSFFQEKTTFAVKGLGKKVDLTPSITENLKSYSAWVSNAVQASEFLQKDMEQAKQQVMDYALAQFAPSREISDYNVKDINFSTLLNKKSEVPSAAPEKSGWLYMKTTVGTPSRQVWVRRWCFLRSSVFGVFLLSLNKTYVEETDKFGVLLTNIRYDPDEDRRFCFEVKILEGRTPDSNGNRNIRIVFQAESLQELKQWLNAFDSAKLHATKLASTNPDFDIAYKRFSPEYFEFASSTTTTTDQLITTYDENSLHLLDILDQKIPGFDLATLPSGNFYQYQMALSPISTKMTQLAILGNLYKKGDLLPNAILANIWGSANWSDYAIFDEAQKEVLETNSKKRKSTKTVNMVDYPSFFPEKKKISDIQFKSLFFTINQNFSKFPDELLLFNFSAFWCPNKRQKFSALFYVTLDHIFCYMNSMGFICLTHKNLDNLVSVEVDPSSDNLVKLYDLERTQFKLYVFFTDRRLVAAKLQYLLENKALMNPKGEEEVLRKFDQLDNEFQEKARNEKLDEARASFAQNCPGVATTNSSNELTKSFWSMNATSAELLHRRKKFQSEYTVMYHHVYEISSKGLMHLMFGDQSGAFPRCLFLSNKDSSSNISSSWVKETPRGDAESELVRVLQFHSNMTNNFLNDLHTGRSPQISIKQRMVKVVENKYYEIDQDPVLVKVPLCNPLSIKVKYLIVEPHEASPPETYASSTGSLLFVFYKLEFFNSKTREVVKNTSFIENMVLKFAVHSTNREFLLVRKIIRYYLEKIGKHGKVIKAIKLCGMLGVSESEYGQNKSQQEFQGSILNMPEKNVVTYTFSIIFKVLVKSFVYRVTGFTLLFIRLVIGLVIAAVSNMTHINKNLLMGLIASVVMNVFLSGKATVAYWSVRRAENVFQDYMQGKSDISVQRAISINDLDLLSQNLAYEHDNLPFKKFNKSESAESRQFKMTRLELGERRNELLVELKILQSMERELVQGNYRSFLLNEMDKCHAVEKEMMEIWGNDTKLQHYCSSCKEELLRLSDLLL